MSAQRYLFRMMAHLVASGVAALVIVLLSLASTSDARSAVRSTAAEGTTTERESDGYSVLNGKQ